MINITHKNSTLRTAIAQAIVSVGSNQTIETVQKNAVPKGNVFEMAKTAGLFAVKKTAELIPDCHPMPIEFTAVRFEISGLEIRIEVEVKTVYKTGVEVEAMHGASVVALTMYDMLKPIDKEIEIKQIKLISKTGGKSDFKDTYHHLLSASVVICSDVVSSGKKPDKAGSIIAEKLESNGLKLINRSLISEDAVLLRSKVQEALASGVNLLIVSGSTGLSKKDIAPDTLQPMLDREIAGIAEASRNYGQQRSPYAMLSRSMAGTIQNMLVLVIPGSSRGAEESMDALFPAVLHFFKAHAAELEKK